MGENALDGRWIDKKQENNPLEETTISEDPDKDPAIKIEKFPKLKDETEEEDAEQQQEVTDWEADHQAPDQNEIKWKKPADTTWIRLKDKQIEELKKKIRDAQKEKEDAQKEKEEGGDKDQEIKNLKEEG